LISRSGDVDEILADLEVAIVVAGEVDKEA
jgi:hypothetical protein